MTARNQQDLVNRGRKAGLSMREIYSSLSTLPAESTQRNSQQVDGNGIVTTVDEQGRREYRPHTQSPSDGEIPVVEG